MEIELNYENWFSGKIELESTYKYFLSDDPNLTSKIVSLESIPDDEVSKIREHQKVLFYEHVEKLFQKFSIDFNLRYFNSPDPKSTLKVEARRIVGIVRGSRSKLDADNIIFNHADMIIPKDAEKHFQNYLNRRIQGSAINSDFMPSPNSQYYSTDNHIPEVFVESLIAHYLHLQKFDESISELALFHEPFHALYSNEPKNESPEIFTSGWAFIAFKRCEELIVLDNSIPGDYLFIFQTLSHKKIGAIHDRINQNVFNSFLEKSYGLKLNKTTLKPSSTKSKFASMKYVLRRYLFSVTDIPKAEMENIIQRVLEKKTT